MFNYTQFFLEVELYLELQDLHTEQGLNANDLEGYAVYFVCNWADSIGLTSAKYLNMVNTGIRH